MQNSNRREQDAWWSEASNLFDGEPTFKNSIAVDTAIAGDPDQAEFVVFALGKVRDADRVRELMRRDSIGKWGHFRPDAIGTVTVIHDGGEMTSVAYFRSKQEFRDGEKKEVPPELMELLDDINNLTVDGPDYLELKEPWLESPKA